MSVEKVSSPSAPTTRPPKPSKEEYQKEMENLSTKIDGLKKDLAQLQAKIPSKDSNSGLSKEKETFKSEFDKFLNQKKDLQKKKKIIFDEIGNLKTSIKKKGDDIKSSRDKLGYKSVAEIDSNLVYGENLYKLNPVSDLDKMLSRGGLSLQEEKKAVAEISVLKKARKNLEALNAQPAGIEADKAKIDALKAQLDAIEKEIKTVDPKVTAAKEKLVATEKELKQSYGSISSLLDQKKEISQKLNDAKDAKNALYTSFKASQDAWYAWEREEKKKRIEAEKAQRAAEREARLVALAEKELEDADIAAFQTEVALCDALVKYFQSVMPHSQDDASAAAPAQDLSKIESSMPARATLVLRKEDREEDFMVLSGSKKNKKKNRNNASAAKPLRLDLELIDQLSKLSISIPKDSSECPAIIDALKEKKQYFLDNSAAQTAANKEAALEKIKKLREAAAAEE